MATTTTFDEALAVSKPTGARRGRPNPGRVLAWVLLGLIMAVTLFPFYWMLRTAFSNGAFLATEPSNLLPVESTLGAFKRVLGMASTAEAQAQAGSGASLNLGRNLLNSIIVSTFITAGQVFFGAMAAYAFSRLKWPGRNAVFFLFLTALMVPPIFTQLPNFLLVRNLGLLNSYVAIILPFFFMTPFAIFFLRQFFLGIPKEVEEAARLDGAGAIGRFTRVILPMASGPLMTLTILQYIQAWGEYFWPLLVASDPEHRTLQVALGVFRSQTPQGAPDWAGLMAATLMAALPVIILFAVFSRKVVNSIGFSGIK